MKTKVVNLRKEPYDVYIGRGSTFGNPFRIGIDGTGAREEVIELYRKRFYELIQHAWFHDQVMKLKGAVLG